MFWNVTNATVRCYLDFSKSSKVQIHLQLMHRCRSCQLYFVLNNLKMKFKYNTTRSRLTAANFYNYCTTLFYSKFSRWFRQIEGRVAVQKVSMDGFFRWRLYRPYTAHFRWLLESMHSSNDFTVHLPETSGKTKNMIISSCRI